MRPVKIVSVFLAACATAAPLVPAERDVATVAAPEVKRSVISEITSILNSVESSVAGLDTEVAKLLSDAEDLDVTAVLNDIKSDLAGDLSLVETILSDVGVGVDLTPVAGLVNTVINIVETVDQQVDGLVANTAVGGLIDDIEGLLSEILKGLGSLV